MKKHYTIAFLQNKPFHSIVWMLLFLFFGSLTEMHAEYINNLTSSWAKAPTAVYSTRKAMSTYSGPAMRLRRSNDDAETDVYFDATGWVSMSSTVTSGGTLEAWVGTNSAYVSKWYDQSGNANHAFTVLNSGFITCSKTSKTVTGGTTANVNITAFSNEISADDALYDLEGNMIGIVASKPTSANSLTLFENAAFDLTGVPFYTSSQIKTQPLFINAGVMQTMPNGKPTLSLQNGNVAMTANGLTTPLTLPTAANVNVFVVARRTNAANADGLLIGNVACWTGASAGNFAAGYSTASNLALRNSQITTLPTSLSSNQVIQYAANGLSSVNKSSIQSVSEWGDKNSNFVNGALTWTQPRRLNLFRPDGYTTRSFTGLCPEIVFYKSDSKTEDFSSTDATTLMEDQRSIFLHVEVPVTIIKVGESQTYKTIQEAYNTGVPATLTQAYVIELEADYNPSREMFPIVLTAKAGASSYFITTIRPAPGVFVALTGSAPQLIKMDGAKYVAIEGRTPTTGNLKNLELLNHSRAAGSSTIAMMNNAVGNTVRYCTVRGAAVSSTYTPTSGTITIGSTAETAASGNNFIDNCDITSVLDSLPTVGVYVVGTTGLTNDNNVINNCNICDFMPSGNVRSSGIYVDGNAQWSCMSGNRFFMSNPRVANNNGLLVPICLNSPSSLVTNNIIDFSKTIGTGVNEITSDSALRFVGIYCTKPITTLLGNTISNIELITSCPGSGSGAEGALLGFYYLGGNLTVSATASKPNTVKNLTLRFRNSMAPTSNFLLGGMSYNYPSGSAQFGFLNVDNLQAIPVGPNASTIVGNVCGVFSILPYGAGCKQVTVSNLSCGVEGSTAPHVVTGISVNSGSNQPVNIERNLVYNLRTISTGASVISGLSCSAGTNTVTYKNNVIALGNEVTSPAEIRGILKASSGKDKIYNNSVYIGGTAPTTSSNTYAYYRKTVTPTAAGEVAQNNIFVNQRMGGDTCRHFAVRFQNMEDYTGTYILNDYNLYYVGTASNCKIGMVGGTELTSFADWKSTLGSFDMNSISVNPDFVAPKAAVPDLSISAASNSVDMKGMLVTAVTDDFFGNVRANLTPSDMGAFAYTYVPSAVKSVSRNSAGIYAEGGSIVMDKLLDNEAFVYTISGQLVVRCKLTCDRVVVPMAQGFYIVRAGNQVAKVIVR